MGTRPGRRANASTPPEILDPEEWNVRLDFSRTHWSNFKVGPYPALMKLADR